MLTRETPSPGEHPERIESALLGGYEIIRPLGEGGTGSVYLARHRLSGRHVALKLLHPELAARSRTVDRFLDEARTVSRLGHENVIDIFYAGRLPDGTPFLAMEYILGRDLAAILATGGPIGWERARGVFIQTARALAAAHEIGVVHGDVKPDNILVTSEGPDERVKVLDFGASRLMGQDGSDAGTPLMATPAYVAPEQVRGDAVDARTDVYALGCVMYQALTGMLPIAGSDPVDVMLRHTYEAIVPPRERRPDLPIPTAVERVIMRAVEKNPADRFPSMGDLERAITLCRFTEDNVDLSPSGLPLLRMSEPARQDRPWLPYALAGAGVLTAGLVALVLYAAFLR